MSWAWGIRKLWPVRPLRFLLASLTDYRPVPSHEWDPDEPETTRRHRLRTTRRAPSRPCLFTLCLGLLFILGLVLYYAVSPKWEDDYGPVMDLGYASYQGTYLKNNISEFLGLPYAQPPIGPLRWRAPVEPRVSEEGTINRAKKFKPLCLGISQSANKDYDEDCLYANVWAPTNATANMKLPVMVFIQGGGYTQLSNGNWNGSQLVEASGNGIVFVNFNYRVGLWGFLAGEEVRQNGDLNTGLLDQRFLLQWVQKHIAKFGGDPGHVVIHGISAGAGSVAMHLASYGGRDDGLYVGAIGESIFFPAQPSVSDLEYQLNRTMEKAGCAGAENRMNCLRGKSMKKLQRLNRPSPFLGQVVDPLFYWSPCIDGDFLQDLPYNLFESQRAVKVPILAGSCTNEGSIFAPYEASSADDFTNFFKINYPGLTESDLESLLVLYPLEFPLPFHDSWYPTASRAYGEATFICPTTNVLNSYAVTPNGSSPASETSATPSIWSYRYNVVDAELVKGGLGVPHVFESPAVFGPAMLPPAIVPSSYWTYNAPIVPLVMKYWLSFVMTLDPNIHKDPGAPVWEPWGPTQSRLLIQLDASGMETVDEAEQERCAFWKDIAGDTQQ